MAADAARVRAEGAPTVDVVVATNRHSPYLDEALASVQAQTWPHWRLIVVDDGSPVPDEIRASCERVGARYIRQEPAGASAAWNRGVRAGSGDLVAYFADDDVWHPERLERQVAVWEANGRCAAVYSGGWYMDAQGQRTAALDAKHATREQFLSGEVNIPVIATMLFRGDVVEQLGGFDESLRFGEDNHLTLRVVELGDVRLAPGEYFGYRRHSGNVTNSPPTESHRSSERLLRILIRDARARRDLTTSSLLRQNLERYRSRAAWGWTGRMVVAVRDRDVRAIRDDTWWSWTRAPGAALGGLVERVGRRVGALRRRADAR